MRATLVLCAVAQCVLVSFVSVLAQEKAIPAQANSSDAELVWLDRSGVQRTGSKKEFNASYLKGDVQRQAFGVLATPHNKVNPALAHLKKPDDIDLVTKIMNAVEDEDQTRITIDFTTGETAEPVMSVYAPLTIKLRPGAGELRKTLNAAINLLSDNGVDVNQKVQLGLDTKTRGIDATVSLTNTEAKKIIENDPDLRHEYDRALSAVRNAARAGDDYNNKVTFLVYAVNGKAGLLIGLLPPLVPPPSSPLLPPPTATQSRPARPPASASELPRRGRR